MADARHLGAFAHRLMDPRRALRHCYRGFGQLFPGLVCGITEVYIGV